jgi:hypothetical protein
VGILDHVHDLAQIGMRQQAHNDIKLHFFWCYSLDTKFTLNKREPRAGRAGVSWRLRRIELQQPRLPRPRLRCCSQPSKINHRDYHCCVFNNYMYFDWLFYTIFYINIPGFSHSTPCITAATELLFNKLYVT